ncbi:MAG TPA: EF-hand domain-containing protein [Gallionella sp.]|nr:EF-hand domain-containing protein [Gallionella sp.]
MMKRMAYLYLTLAMASPLAVAADGVDALLENKEPATPIERAFNKLDANHDGVISRGEVQLKQTALLLDNFAKIDENKDDGISLQEFQKFLETLRAKQEEFFNRLKAADKNGDGEWTLKELKSAKAKLPSLEKNFDAIDSNHDKKITAQEIDAFAHAIR